MIGYYVTLIIVVIGLSVFFFLAEKFDIGNNNKSYPIPNPKIEIQEEWFETKKGYFSKKENQYKGKKPYLNDKGKWMLDGVVEEGTPMIKITYTFYSLNGIGGGQHREYTPTDLAPFYKTPFNRWHEPNSENIDCFKTFHFNHDDHYNSYFGWIYFIADRSDYYIELDYKGAKHLTEEDKDFFMKKIQCHINERAESSDFKRKIYYLHF